MFSTGVMIWLLGFPVYQSTDGRINQLEQQLIKRGDGLNNRHWPVQIRPPPVAAQTC